MWAGDSREKSMYIRMIFYFLLFLVGSGPRGVGNILYAVCVALYFLLFSSGPVS